MDDYTAASMSPYFIYFVITPLMSFLEVHKYLTNISPSVHDPIVIPTADASGSSPQRLFATINKVHRKSTVEVGPGLLNP